MLHLELRLPPPVPLDVTGVLPEALRELSLRQVERCPVRLGNQTTVLADWFAIRGEPSDAALVWGGDLARVHRLGLGMRRGSMIIDGPAGDFVGTAMDGGTVEVRGSAGDCVGAEMRGGTIRVQGDVGDHLAAALPTGCRGMVGGTILVGGSAGDWAAWKMRRGLVAIGGDAGRHAANALLAGTLLVLGRVGPAAAAGMMRGSLVIPRSDGIELLPTFRRGAAGKWLILELLSRAFSRLGWTGGLDDLRGIYAMYHGDLLEGGRGEVFVRVP